MERTTTHFEDIFPVLVLCRDRWNTDGLPQTLVVVNRRRQLNRMEAPNQVTRITYDQ